jgi:hypothetical protein
VPLTSGYRKSGLDLLKEMRRWQQGARVGRDGPRCRGQPVARRRRRRLPGSLQSDELGAHAQFLRRDIAREDNVLRNGDVELDPAAHTVQQAGKAIDLDPEFARWRPCSSGPAPRCRRRS